MHRTLITLLGRTPRTESGYRRTRYRFPDGSRTAPTGVLGWSLAERLRPDRLLVLGTAGSMWDYLVESVDLGDRDEEVRLALQDAVDRRAVDQAQLDRTGDLLAAALDLDLRLRLIPYGRDAGGQMEVLETIAREVEAGDRLVLDVTHAFRHLPMLALMSALHLEVVKGVSVESIYYGFYDPDTGEAPVYDLAGLLDIVAWVKASSAFDKDGDYGVFAGLLERAGVSAEACANLEQAAFFERTTRAGDARGQLRRFRTALEEQPPGGPAALFAPVLRERTAWVEDQRLYQRQRALAARYLDRGDHLRAAIYAFEAFITARVAESGGDPGNFDARAAAKQAFEDGPSPARKADYRLLRDLRNALAHGSSSTRRDILEAMATPERLRATLAGLLERLLSAAD